MTVPADTCLETQFFIQVLRLLNTDTAYYLQRNFYLIVVIHPVPR